MYVKERFVLAEQTKRQLRSMRPIFGYGQFSEFIFYKHYSRPKSDGSMETWADVIIRVTEGTMSIRKDHMVRNNLEWNEFEMQHYAVGFAVSMFKMHWLPPGRGMWAMGTDFVYERGAMPLYNCAFTDITDFIGDDIHWAMDCLMNGVGVGAEPLYSENLKVTYPIGLYEFEHTKLFDGLYETIPIAPTYIIEDSREGWCDATKALIDSYLTPGTKLPIFDYSKVRPAGSPIKGFGGIASGPEPLEKLHYRIRRYMDQYICDPMYNSMMLKADIINAVGVCVVSGNVRRSAEILSGSIDDETFLNLKDYTINPYRAEVGWMSNNSVNLDSPEDFEKLGEIAERVIRNGEPGFINRMNFKYGRVNKTDQVKIDYATGINPCGEIPLENKEVCNVVETFPTCCRDQYGRLDEKLWYMACNYATFYTSTVSLLPTHRNNTNKVVAKNRRIGVSLVDFTGWKHEVGLNKVISYLRKGYESVCTTNRWANAEAGVPEAIRKTTVKPGGTIPKVPGKTSGAGHPTFIFTLRRVRVSKYQPIFDLLVKAGIPYEPEVNDPENTYVFEFPIKQGPAKPAEEVSLWEQATNLVTLQREWADNAVSNTLYFKPKWILVKHLWSDSDLKTAELEVEKFGFALDAVESEEETRFTKVQVVRNESRKVVDVKLYKNNPKHEEGDIESVISSIAPSVKSVSLLPHTAKGVYQQMPEEGITEEEYNTRISKITYINWSDLRGSIPEAELYCEGDKCQITSQ